MNIDYQIAALIERKEEIEKAKAEAAKAFSVYAAKVNALSKVDPQTAKNLKLGILRNYCVITGRSYLPSMLKEFSFAQIAIDLVATFDSEEEETND